MTDHERIWLEPGEGGDEGRLWCQDNVWLGDPNYGGQEATEYVRADLYARLTARIAELEAALWGAIDEEGETSSAQKSNA